MALYSMCDDDWLGKTWSECKRTFQGLVISTTHRLRLNAFLYCANKIVLEIALPTIVKFF